MRSPARILRRLDHEIRTLINTREERRYDRAAGVVTGGRHGHSAEAEQESAFEHALLYQGVSARRFAQIVEALPLDPRETAFIDFGSGKGKALFLAADHGFRRVVGVEFAPDLSAIAEENARSYARTRPGRAAVETVCMDAAEYPLPDQDSLLFLYNPFNEVVMARVAESVARSLADHPRTLYVVYLNPRHPGPWERSPALTAVALPADILDPEPVRPFRGLRGHEHGADVPVRVWTAVLPRSSV